LSSKMQFLPIDLYDGGIQRRWNKEVFPEGGFT
jgi:hypothetical protein